MKRERNVGRDKKRAQEKKKHQGAKSDGILSVSEIVEDPLTALSLEHWGDDVKEVTLSLELVRQIYDDVLMGDSAARIHLLETSKYLER